MIHLVCYKVVWMTYNKRMRIPEAQSNHKVASGGHIVCAATTSDSSEACHQTRKREFNNTWGRIDQIGERMCSWVEMEMGQG